jgi:hypothetical protein
MNIFEAPMKASGTDRISEARIMLVDLTADGPNPIRQTTD